MFGSEDVFKRHGMESTISDRLYNVVIGITLFWGFIINFLMVKYIPVSLIASIHPVVFIIAYFALCIAGCVLFSASNDPVVSFLGYNLVVIPFGFIINLVVSKYDPNVVFNAVGVTCIVTLIMMAISTAFPKAFKDIGPALFIALGVTILVELFMIMFTGHSSRIIDWVVIIIFCGYVGFDWYRANTIPKTVDNAIDSAAALYMDIINLFVRILGVSVSSKSDK